MTIDHVYTIINKTMKALEDIDMIDLEKRKYNQIQLNEAYKILDEFRDELIREKIKIKNRQN